MIRLLYLRLILALLAITGFGIASYQYLIGIACADVSKATGAFGACLNSPHPHILWFLIGVGQIILATWILISYPKK